MASMMTARTSVTRAVRANVARPRTCQPRRMLLVRAEGKQVGNVQEEVIAIIAKQLAVEPTKVTPASTFVDLGADSLDTVEIMMALEETYDIQLSEEGAEKIKTVGDAAKLIADQINAK